MTLNCFSSSSLNNSSKSSIPIGAVSIAIYFFTIGHPFYITFTKKGFFKNPNLLRIILTLPIFNNRLDNHRPKRLLIYHLSNTQDLPYFIISSFLRKIISNET